MAKGVGQGVGGGRPKKVINYAQVTELAQFSCTQAEIASFLKLSLARCTSDSKFIQAYNAGLDSGRVSLRKMQFKSALEGNSSLLIWLGKNILKQRDNVDIEHSGGITTDYSKLTLAQLQKLAGEAEETDDTEE